MIDLTGQRFGRLTVIRRGENKGVKLAWECVCDCGNTKTIESFQLRRGLVVSCRCFHSEMTSTRSTIHGDVHSPLYNIWHAMRSRCYNTKTKNFHRYGGRGIKVCERWRSSYENFRDDMGPRPPDKHPSGKPIYSLERIDNNGDYEPKNCRWATGGDQTRNSTHARILTHNGKRQCLKDWAREVGITENALYYRLKRGWTLQAALTR